MIQKAITKYGLAFHLALLAAIPSALAPFVSDQTLGGVVLWLSLFAALWIFIEPSILPGEHLSLARARVCASLVRDPVLWFFVLYSVLCAVRWLNTGMEMAYDPEKVAWKVSEPSWTVFPCCVGGSGFLPFTVAVGATVLAAGVRHAIGLGARSSFALSGSFFAGLGGFAAASFACAGVSPFAADAVQGFGIARSPETGGLFGVWLLVGIGAGVLAEARKWTRGRVFHVVAIGGNIAGLVFFSPPLVVSGYLVAAALFAFFCLLWLGRVSSMGATARNVVFLVLGLLLPTFLLMSFSTEEFKKSKLGSLDPAVAWDAKLKNVDSVLSDVSKRLWLAEPWRGAGLKAFKLKAPFVVKREEWEVIPNNAERPVNGYWELLSERGNVMCGLFALGLGLMAWSWGARLVGAFLKVRADQDADPLVFSCSPEVWTPLIFVPLLAVESLFTSVCSVGTLLLAVIAALQLATASFPRQRSADNSNEEN